MTFHFTQGYADKNKWTSGANIFEVITMIFVGIDVAKDTHYAAVSDD